MEGLIGLAAVAAVLAWLVRRRPRAEAAPEDDVTTPMNKDKLAEAERELEADGGARSLEDGFDDDEDDWGPGTA